jgi:hypothetical protein
MRQAGPGAFLIVTGDIDPPAPLRATLDRFMGTNYPWHPVVGNHDKANKKVMGWLRQQSATSKPGPIHPGPAGCESTTYSFNHGRAHFIIVNQYYNGKTDAAWNNGWSKALTSWLEADLEANRQPVVFVAGHVPLKIEADMDTGKKRHSDSKNPVRIKARDKIVALLEKHHVTGFLCGHTHNCSVTRQGMLWQLDGGHAQGMGSKTSRSAFLKCFVGSRFCWVEVYRDDGAGGPYSLEDRIVLTP